MKYKTDSERLYRLLCFVATVHIEVFWVVTLCCLAGGYYRFGELYCLHVQGPAYITQQIPQPTHFDPGDECNIFLQKVGNHQQDYTVS
jgi:hypothetical protein